MHPRLALVPAALAVAALMNADLAAASHACPTRSSTTVEIVQKTREAVVFNRAPRRPSGGGPSKLTYGCYFRKGSTYRLNFVSDTGGFDYVGLRTLRLAGRFVAYENGIASAAGSDFPTVVVRNLVDGRVVRSHPAADDPDGITDLEVKRNGSVAWIASVPEPGARNPGRAEVRVADRAGERVLDSGNGIGFRSLSLSADRASVRWFHAGEARSAPID